jgi:hypothetical protein
LLYRLPHLGAFSPLIFLQFERALAYDTDWTKLDQLVPNARIGLLRAGMGDSISQRERLVDFLNGRLGHRRDRE